MGVINFTIFHITVARSLHMYIFTTEKYQNRKNTWNEDPLLVSAVTKLRGTHMNPIRIRQNWVWFSHCFVNTFMYVCFLVLRFCLGPTCMHVCCMAIYNYCGAYLVPCLVPTYVSKFFVTTRLYTYICMLYGNIGILWFVLVTLLRNYVYTYIYIYMLNDNIGIL